MQRFKLKIEPSDLSLSEDIYYWRCNYKPEPNFNLRRSKCSPEEISEINFGSLDDIYLKHIFMEFMIATGGIKGSFMLLKEIGKINTPHDEVVRMFDRTKLIIKQVYEFFGKNSKDTFLMQEGNEWSAIFIF